MSTSIESTGVSLSDIWGNELSSISSKRNQSNSGDFDGALSAVMDIGTEGEADLSVQNGDMPPVKSMEPKGEPMGQPPQDGGQFAGEDSDSSEAYESEDYESKWEVLNPPPQEEAFSMLESAGDGLMMAAKFATGGIASFLS